MVAMARAHHGLHGLFRQSIASYDVNDAEQLAVRDVGNRGLDCFAASSSLWRFEGSKNDPDSDHNAG